VAIDQRRGAIQRACALDGVLCRRWSTGCRDERERGHAQARHS
jgi:hypothetical protein